MRPCGCGCGTDLDTAGKAPAAKYLNAAHRAVAFRERHGIRPVSAAVPEREPTQPPAPDAKARAGEYARSGVQLSYWKAVDILTAELVRDTRWFPVPTPALPAELEGRRLRARAFAERVLYAALPPAQKAKLDARHGGPHHEGSTAVQTPSERVSSSNGPADAHLELPGSVPASAAT